MNRTRTWLSCCALALAPIACGEGDDPNGPGPSTDDFDDDAPQHFELLEPSLESVTPTRVTLGAPIDVWGDDFIHPQNGTMRIELTGTFDPETGPETPWEGSLDLDVVARGHATFQLEQPFAPGTLGTFYGSAKVVSHADVQADNAPQGSERESKQVAVTLELQPSIQVIALRSVDTEQCEVVTRATNGGSQIVFGVEAIGLGDATYDEPITVRVGFLSPELTVTYVKEDVYESWPLDWHPGLNDTVFADAPAGRSTMTFTIDAGRRLMLDPREAPIRAHISPGVMIRSENRTDVLLGRMTTGPVDAAAGSSVATFFVEMERGDETLARVAELQVWPEFETMPYEGGQRLVQRYPAEIPSGFCGSCIPGGDIGRDLSYSEGESSSRTRSVSMRWDVNTANSVGLSAGHMVFAQAQLNSTWSSTFGTDVSEAVTTENHVSLNLQAHVLPTFYGICYRQLSRYEKSVDVVYHGECGGSAVVGQAVLTDWGWGFDVATGPECTPRTNLPDPFEED